MARSVFLTRIKPRIEAEQKKPSLPVQLARIREARMRRHMSMDHPRMIDWLGSSGEPVFGLLPGTISVFWAAKNTGTIAKIERAVSMRDETVLKQLHEHLFAGATKRPVLSLKNATDKLLREPVHFDLRCGGETLAECLGLFGSPCGSLILAYSGGPLKQEDFSIVEYRKTVDTTSYEVLVVRSMPSLTELERKAIAAVPGELAEMHVAAAVSQMCNTAVVAVAVVVAANTFAVNCGAKLQDQLSGVRLPSNLQSKLDSKTSARELVRLRLELLRRSGLS